MPFMNDLTTFTAPFETDVGQTFQLVLVTPQCPLCLCVCVGASVLKELILVLVLCSGFAPFETDLG